MIAQVDPGEAVNGYRYAFAPCQGDAERKVEILEGAGHLPEVEAAGFEEVILYFNVGLKPHAQVKEEMDRFMREVAPQFEGKHKRMAAE